MESKTTLMLKIGFKKFQDIDQTETSTPTLSIIEFNLIKNNSNIYQLEMSTLIRYI